MPTYDYYCEKCETTFEIFQSMNDKKLKKCIDQSCGGSVERLLEQVLGLFLKVLDFMKQITGVIHIKLEQKRKRTKKNPVVMTQLRKNLIKRKKEIKENFLVLINCA